MDFPGATDIPEVEPSSTGENGAIEPQEQKPVLENGHGDAPSPVRFRDHISKCVPRQMVELIFWDNPRITVILFTASFLLLIFFNTMSFITLFAYLNLCIMVSAWLLRLYASVQNTINSQPQAHPLQDWLAKDVSVTPEKIGKFAESYCPILENLLNNFRDILIARNVFNTIKVALVMYALTFVGAIMNFLTFITISFVALFTVPLIYDKYQKQINALIKLLLSRACCAMKDLQTKAEPKMRQAYEKLPPSIQQHFNKFIKQSNGNAKID